MLIYPADQIARQLQRGVLYVAFGGPETDADDPYFLENMFEGYKRNVIRPKFLEFLDSHKIEHQHCLPCEPVKGSGLICGYFGHIYVNVIYNVDDPNYQLVQQFLEHDDGTMRYEDVNFYYLSLENALKNAHHDTEEWKKKQDEWL